MTEQLFWNTIDSSWNDSLDLADLRRFAIQQNDEGLLEKLSYALEDEISENYKKRLSTFDLNDFTAFIHLLEKKLYDLDRKDIHEYAGGSDDGFLYARCFIVGMGQEYYNRIIAEPSKAKMDL